MAAMIRQFKDQHQLFNECKHNPEMALFCGVKQTDRMEIIEREAVEQWRACRKGK